MKKIILILLPALFLLSPAARAWDRDTETKTLQDQLDKVKDVCGQVPEATIDWSSFDASDPGPNHIGEACQAMADALYAICGVWNNNPYNQDAVRKIKKLDCVFGGAGKRAVSLTPHGTLRYTVDWDTQDNRDFITTYLKKAIGAKDKS